MKETKRCIASPDLIAILVQLGPSRPLSTTDCLRIYTDFSWIDASRRRSRRRSIKTSFNHSTAIRRSSPLVMWKSAVHAAFGSHHLISVLPVPPASLSTFVTLPSHAAFGQYESTLITPLFLYSLDDWRSLPASAHWPPRKIRRRLETFSMHR